MSLAMTTTCQDSTTPGSATARAICEIIHASPFNASDWPPHELTQYNVKINKTTFPKEIRELIFAALDSVPKLAVTTPQDDPLAFSADAAFILFPRLILRSLPPGCQGKYASLAFAERCEKLIDARITELIEEAHESQVKRVARRVHGLSQPTQ